MAAFLTMSFTSVAQNKFKGIVKYNVTAEGNDAKEFAAQATNLEIKVMNDDVLASGFMTILLTRSPFVNTIAQSGRTLSVSYDFSQILTALDMNGVSLTSYQGKGKMLLKTDITQEMIDSLTIASSEPGYYIEYTDQTKKIAGQEAKLAKIHINKDDETQTTEEIWYCPTMGPQHNFIFNGIQGVVMEMTIQLDETNSLTLTASEVVKGKVKEVEFLPPAGFEKTTEEDSQTFMAELFEELENLQEE